MPKSGDILDGRYQIVQEIGKGGTGIIFLGYHLTLCKYVVIKKIKDHFVGNINARGEVDILKKLHHRHLPQVYDFLVIGTEVYTIMDYVDGHDLSWFVDNGYVFTEDQMVAMLIQLCEVLQYLHSQDPPVIHSDIKPGNIMIRSDGDICLIDFNISLDGEEGKVLGYSPHFAAPEQIELAEAVLYGKKHDRVKLDEKTDIYSLGASFYYLMTGILPAGNAADTIPLKKIRTFYSKDLVRIVQKAMEPSRLKRYASAEKMRNDLEHKRTGQKRLLLGLCLVLLIALLSMGALAGIYQSSEKQKRRYISAFSEFTAQMQGDDYQKLRKLGMEILNDAGLEKQLALYPEQRSQILKGIAESYFEEENYSAASVYFKEAYGISQNEKNKVSCLRDYILSLIKSGNVPGAQQELSDAERIFSSDILHYLQAELFMQQGENGQALLMLIELTETGTDREIRQRSCLQAADCLKGSGRDDERLELLKRAQQLCDKRMQYRKIAEGLVEISQNENEKKLQDEALLLAKNSYESLCQDQMASYLDRLNYACVLALSREYQKAMAVLQELEEEFPEDYRSYREEAFVCYQMECRKDSADRDYQGVFYYGRQAMEKSSGKEEGDEKLELLKELMAQLPE